MSRVLLRFRKGDKAKYISHRDLMRAFDFALRRARIPVAYSLGFNPRPRMSFGSAIGVGVTSDDELIVLELALPLDASDIKGMLNSQLPVGLEVLAVEDVPDGVKSPLSGLNASRFQIVVACDPTAIGKAIEELLAADEVHVVRTRGDETREIDIRPHLLQVDKTEYKGDSAIIEVSLRSGDSGGAGPQDFLQALRNLAPNFTVKKIHRLKQFRATDDSVSSGC